MTVWECDEAEIAEIESWDLYLIDKEEEDPTLDPEEAAYRRNKKIEERDPTAFDLVPESEHYNLIALIVANDDVEQAERILSTWRWVTVRRYAALQYARQWRPKEEKEDEEEEPDGSGEEG